MVESFSEEEVVQWFSVKRKFLKILQKSLENTCARVSFLIKFQASDLQLYLKGDSGTDVSCDFFEISQNTFSYRTLPVAASASIQLNAFRPSKL